MRDSYPNELPLKLIEYSNLCTLYIDEISHCILFTTSIFVNKYVLSVLKFTYPTVFQGWQTLVGVLILKFLTWRGKPKLEVTPLDRKGIFNMLPHLLFYIGSIVAGSKALASLPVPVFLSACSLSPASIFLLDHFPGPCNWHSILTLIPATVALISSAFVLLLCDAEISEVPELGESPYFWMLVHVVLITAQSLHDRVADTRYSAMDRLYYANLFGPTPVNPFLFLVWRLVILAPASLYLEEAFLALQFRHRRQFHFYIGCILSGVLGLLLRMRTIGNGPLRLVPWGASSQQVPLTTKEKIMDDSSVKRCVLSNTALISIMASLLSLITFRQGTIKVGVIVSTVTSLVASLFIPSVDYTNDDIFNQSEVEEKRMDVFLMIRRKKMTIFTDTKETTSVHELKKIIEGILKYPPENQQLFNKDTQLMEDDKTLQDYGLTSVTAKAQCPAAVGLAIRQENGEFEPLELTPFSSPPDLPDVMKAPESNGQEQSS